MATRSGWAGRVRRWLGLSQTGLQRGATAALGGGMADLGEAWRLILGAGRREGPRRGGWCLMCICLGTGKHSEYEEANDAESRLGAFTGPCGANAERHQVGNIRRAGSIISTLFRGEARPRRV